MSDGRVRKEYGFEAHFCKDWLSQQSHVWFNTICWSFSLFGFYKMKYYVECILTFFWKEKIRLCNESKGNI